MGTAGDVAVAPYIIAPPFCALAVVLSAIDVRRRIVPNRIVLPAVAVAFAVRTALDPSPRWAIAGCAAFATFAAVSLVHSSSVGMGDAKVALLLGVVLGASVMPAIVLAFFATLPFSLAVLVKHGRTGMRRSLPFAPFLMGAGVVVLLAP